MCDEDVSPKKLIDPNSLPRHPSSLHELRVTSNSIRVEPGRYRVFGLPPYISNQPINSPKFNANGHRNPLKGVGSGQPLGKNEISGGSFVKSMEMMPNLAKRRYFQDEEEEVLLEYSPKKTRVVKRYETQLTQATKIDEIPNLTEEVVENIEEVVESSFRHEEQPETSEAAEYTEEAVEVIDGEQEHEGAYAAGYNHNSLFIRPAIGLGNVQLLKQLRGENNYLKDQLELSTFRIKQLEQLLLDRNTRLRGLLAENVQLGVNVRKLTAELGEDAAREILEVKERKKR